MSGRRQPVLGILGGGQLVRMLTLAAAPLGVKTLVVDTLYGSVGSANFDNRSFRLNFEVMAVVMDRAFNQRLAEMFDDDLSHCKLVPLDRRAPPWQQLFEAVARLASPLL